MKSKSELYKRCLDTKMSDAFEFPLKADFAARSWELQLEVFDSQSGTCLGAVYLDLNDIFSEDLQDQNRTPLVLSYTSITVALQPVIYQQDVSGSITFSLSTTTPFPKRPLVRERLAGVVDLAMTPEAIKLSLLDAEFNWMSSLDSSVELMEKLMPELMEAAGGPAMVMNILNDGTVAGVAVSSSTPKLKGLLKGLGTTKKGGSEGTSINELPLEILNRIFSHLPPWKAVTSRRVCSLWSSLAAPGLPDLWALLHAASRATAKKLPMSTRDFCRAAFPFLQHVARITAFMTGLNFSLPKPPPPRTDKWATEPVVLGPVRSIMRVTRVLTFLELWRTYIIGLLGSNQSYYDSAIQMFKLGWKTHLPDDLKQSAEAAMFDDTQFWWNIEKLFTVQFTFLKPLSLASNLLNVQFAVGVMAYSDALRAQLTSRKGFTTDDEARELCSSYILLSVFGMIVLGPPKSKMKNLLGFLKDYEPIIPPEYTRLLVFHNLMKDKTYTKF